MMEKNQRELRNGNRPRRRSLLWITALLALLVLAACGKVNYQPEAIHEGVDRCTVCNMLIKDDANATEIVLKDQRVLKFDDIVDMYQWTKKNGLKDIAVRYVRDFNTKEWVKLEEAEFVNDKEHPSPMSNGIVAFKSKADAEKYIADNKRGKLMSPQELDNFPWDKSGDKMKGMEMNGMSGTNDKNGMNGGTGAMKQ